MQVFRLASFGIMRVLISFARITRFQLTTVIVLLSHFSRVQLCATPLLGFSRQEHCHCSGAAIVSFLVELSGHTMFYVDRLRLDLKINPN